MSKQLNIDRWISWLNQVGDWVKQEQLLFDEIRQSVEKTTAGLVEVEHHLQKVT